jgi:hypothetical protein
MYDIIDKLLEQVGILDGGLELRPAKYRDVAFIFEVDHNLGAVVRRNVGIMSTGQADVDTIARAVGCYRHISTELNYFSSKWLVALVQAVDKDVDAFLALAENLAEKFVEFFVDPTVLSVTDLEFYSLVVHTKHFFAKRRVLPQYLVKK